MWTPRWRPSWASAALAPAKSRVPEMVQEGALSRTLAGGQQGAPPSLTHTAVPSSICHSGSDLLIALVAPLPFSQLSLDRACTKLAA